MARIFNTGAEFNDTSSAGLEIISGGPSGPSGLTIFQSATIVTSPRTGTYAWQCASGAGNVTQSIGCNFTGVAGRTYYFCGYVNFTNLPGTTVKLVDWTSTGVVSAKITTGGKLQLWNDTGTPAQIGSDSDLTLTTATWYRVEMSLNLGTGATDSVELRVATGDGAAATVASASGISLSDVQRTSVNFGWTAAPGANLTCLVDDMAINDDQGANQNTWIGAHGIVVLLPTADAARATLWQNGAGTTTALWDAVNNRPPVGKLTASKTAITQIQHAGGAAGTTDAYDATMTTYIAAGVPSYAKINLVQCVDADGEDIATGTKLLAFSINSNPAVATSGNITVGGDVGACGTYAVNWSIHIGTLTYAPTVTLGTAPVMRVVRPETVTRLADVCFMGILVDFSPLPVRPSMNESQSGITLNQAPMRAATW